jgi:hypothetical protein
MLKRFREVCNDWPETSQMIAVWVLALAMGVLYLSIKWSH